MRPRRCCCAPASTSTQGRAREAALQLRAGLAALLAEPTSGAGAAQREDLDAIAARRSEVERLADAALRRDIEPVEQAALAHVLGPVRAGPASPPACGPDV